MKNLVITMIATTLLSAPSADAADVETTKLLEAVLAEVKKSAETITMLKDKIATLETANTDLSENLKEIKSEANAGNYSMPSGAVVAFDHDLKTSPGCPAGWIFFEPAGGRMIVGAGDHDNKWFRAETSEAVSITIYPTYVQDDRAGIQETFNARATGGEEAVALDVTQMPSHGHKVSTGYMDGSWYHDGFAGGASRDGLDTVFNNPDPKIRRDGGHGVFPDALEKTGGLSSGVTKAHNNMPPYIALYYCKKN